MIRALAAAAAALTLAAGWATATLAQDNYPSKQITILVGSPPGGPTDTFARLVAPEMSKRLGQTVVVENRPGAAGGIAAQGTLQAPADGYTLWFTTTSHLVIPTIMRDPPPFARDALRPVAGVAYGPGALLASPKAPFSTLEEFVAYAKAHPEELNFGSSGVGSNAHIVMERIMDQLGIKLTHVPYNGNGPAMAALMANEVQVMGGDLGSARGNIQDGTVKAISILALDRSSIAPDVKTADETGLLPGFNPVFYLGFVVRAETPDPIVAKLNGVVDEALAEPAVKEQIEKAQFVVLGGAPEEFRKLYEDDAAATRPILEKLGLVGK